RQERLEALQKMVYSFASEFQSQGTTRREGYMRLLRAFMAAMEKECVPADAFAVFACTTLMPAVEAFSKTPGELCFMEAKMISFFAEVVSRETAEELRQKEGGFPIYHMCGE